MNGDQDQYAAAIKELGRRTGMPPQTAARIECDLQRAFAARQVAGSGRVARKAAGRWSRWLAAAAAALVAVTGIQVWRGGTTAPEDQATILYQEAAPMAVRPSVTPPARTGLAVPDPKPSVTPRRAGRPKLPAARVVRPSGFVALPGSAGLPQFESGTIVRMELPVAALPTYGIDISPAAGDRMVEADVLVGQDGHARAMRLITNSSRSEQ
jgi:hypothetical protein